MTSFQKDSSMSVADDVEELKILLDNTSNYHLMVLSGKFNGIASHSTGPVHPDSLFRGNRNPAGSRKKDIVPCAELPVPYIYGHKHLCAPTMARRSDSVWFHYSGKNEDGVLSGVPLDTLTFTVVHNDNTTEPYKEYFIYILEQEGIGQWV
jgi:hypothetical protein